jgi:hypothetical protein
MNELIFKVMAIVVAAILLVGSGHKWGSSSKQAEWAAAELSRKNAETLAVSARASSNAKVADTQAAINVEIKKENISEKKAINDVRGSVDARGLRLPATICPRPARPAPSTSTSRSDDPASGAGVLPQVDSADILGEVILPEALARDISDRAEEADLVVASCRGLQKFVRDNKLAP